MFETINYAKSLGVDWCCFIHATVLRGTEMYAQFVQMGCIEDNINTWSKSFFEGRSFDTPEISAEGLNELIYRTNLEVNFINNVNMIKGNFSKAIEIFNDIVVFYPFHIIGWYCLMQSYKGLGNIEKAQEVKKKITVLINSDKRSAEMFSKYGDLMGEFNEK
jgi:hypothetical protein